MRIQFPHTPPGFPSQLFLKYNFTTTFCQISIHIDIILINYSRNTCIQWLSLHCVSCTILYSLQVITALFFFYFPNFSLFLKQFMPRFSTQLKRCANIPGLIHYASPALFITAGWGFLFVPYWYFSDISRRADKRICSINHIEQRAQDWCLISVCTIETLPDVNKCRKS